MANKDSDVYKNLVRIEEPEARIHVDAPDGVLPLALNVELPGGYVSEAVPSGVRLPHTATAMFSTADSFQLAAEFHILMGNRPLACDNIPLCRIRVRNIKWSGAGVPQIELRFDIDEAGMLTVSAANLDRSNAEIVVFTAGDEVAHDDVRRALADADEHKADDQATRDLIQKMLDCYALIGATNDYYSAAKKKMGHGAKSAYKQARKRLEQALSVDVADATDEATGGGNWTQGTTTPDNMSDTKDSAPTWYWPYSDIRNCNIFIQNAQNPEVCTIDRELADRLTYEARFIRAYLYFEMVKRYGGVPLITIPQEMTDDLYVKRNSTKECFDFIIDELKACAEGLPDSYSAEDLGRVTKGAAKAFLGRVFLFRASPQFNPNNNEHWQTAYNYNKETLNYLIGQGHALYDDYGKLFLDEMNKEVIFAIRYENPTRTQKRDATVRPITFSMNNTGGNHPTQEVIDRFPTIDGGTYTYADWEKEGKDIFALWENRDKRFYATIVYQGVTYFNTVMELNENAQNDYAYGKNVGSKTGYYSRKAIDESLSVTDCQKSGTDYIDIRLAEVMLNYAEAAVEVGKTNEAFDMLKQIRKRAGINETSSNPEMKGRVYGLNPNMNQTEMREAVREERFIELLFEQKRLWDMRRWMIYDKLMNGQGKRHALVMNKQADNTYTTYLFDRDNTPMITNQNIYFLPMKRSEMSNNPNLEQTKGWENGTFDPQAGL